MASAIQISSILLNSAQAGSNFDFGDYLPVSVAGIVYTDTNASGVYNSASDPALVGVTLTLSGTDGLGHPVNATTTSGAGGAYSFGTLRPGTYTVTETVPATYTATASPPAGGHRRANDGTASTSGIPPSTVISGIVTTSGQSGVNFNFGDFLPVSVAGIVYTDANGSGVYTNSASDPALVGVTLTLSGTNGKGIAITPVTTTTLAERRATASARCSPAPKRLPRPYPPTPITPPAPPRWAPASPTMAQLRFPALPPGP